MPVCRNKKGRFTRCRKGQKKVGRASGSVQSREREAARKYWKSLPRSEKWAIGDALVTGDFDWRDWFDKKPSAAFLDELDNERMLWETRPE